MKSTLSNYTHFGSPKLVVFVPMLKLSTRLWLIQNNSSHSRELSTTYVLRKLVCHLYCEHSHFS